MPQDVSVFLNTVFELMTPEKNSEILQLVRTNLSHARNVLNFSYAVMLAICGEQSDMFEPCLYWVTNSKHSYCTSDEEKAALFAGMDLSVVPLVHLSKCKDLTFFLHPTIVNNYVKALQSKAQRCVCHANAITMGGIGIVGKLG
jgi:hypothetical protein